MPLCNKSSDELRTLAKLGSSVKNLALTACNCKLYMFFHTITGFSKRSKLMGHDCSYCSGI